MSRPFAVIGLTVFLVSAVLYDSEPKSVLIAFLVFTAALCVCVLIKSIRRQSVFPVAFASAALACLMIICIDEFSYYPALKLDGTVQSAKIRITGECTAKYGNFYYEGETTEIEGEKAKVKVRMVFSSSQELSPYDTIGGDFSFFKLGSSSDDLTSSYKADGRYLGVYPEKGEYSVIEYADESFHPGKLIISLRGAIKSSVLKILPNDYGALCTAMLLGDRTSLSDNAYQSLRTCGVTHIICVSGLHLSLWSAALLWILKKTKLKEKTACIIALPSVVFLMILTGMSYSVVRSGIMMIVYLLSVIISQRRDALNSLGIAMLVISISNPFAPGSLSLQLSALSTLGIILCNEYVMPGINGFFKAHERLWILEKPVKLLTITCAAVSFTLPVTLTTYGSFNFSVFPSNLLIIWLAQACMICAALGAAVAMIGISVINLPGFAAGVFAKCILKLASAIGNNGIAEISVSQKDAYIILCGLFAFCALCVLVAYTGKKVLPAAAASLAGIFVFSMCFYSFTESRLTRITVIDSGNGSTALISCRGENVLVGCGGETFNGAYSIKNAVMLNGGELDAVFLPYDSEEYSSYLGEVTGKYAPKCIICKNPSYLTELIASKSKLISEPESLSLRHIKLSFQCDAAGNSVLTVTTDDVKAAFAFDPQVNFNELSEDISSAEVLVCRMDYPENAAFDGIKAVVVQADNNRGCVVQSELISQGITAAATAECGDIIIKSDNHSVCLERG